MRWVNYGQLILGLWVLLAPWILGYASLAPALWSSVISGVLISLLALWSILNEGENNQ
jgi:hypothetical protein